MTAKSKIKSVYDLIKKQNGERFAKTIRAYDNGIFDVPNLVQIVKYAGRDAKPILNYLESLKDIQIEEHGVYQPPLELLKLAGYDAYYADTFEKQNAISKYFKEDEKLCTFDDKNRYKKYYIINAVKYNVEEIKRENFPNPKREDTYGTSVLSIQILKTGGFISIKNRYNHTVENPDNTFNSNPDNIIQGLSESIKHYLHVDFSAQQVNLPDNFITMNGQIINYEYEINDTYFGKDYYAKEGIVYELDKNHEVMLDYFILDLKNKIIKNPSDTNDCFLEVFKEEIKGKKLQIIVNKNAHKCLWADGIQLLELVNGKSVSLYLPSVTVIGNEFLKNNITLTSLTAPNLTTVGDYFLYFNENLSSINIPNLSKTGNHFLDLNITLISLTAINLTSVGEGFLGNNKALSSLIVPKLTTVGNDFLYSNEALISLIAPRLTSVGTDSLYNNKILTCLIAPRLTTIDDGFLYNNTSLSYLNLPSQTTNKNKNSILFYHPNRDKLFACISKQKTSLTQKLKQYSNPSDEKHICIPNSKLISHFNKNRR